MPDAFIPVLDLAEIPEGESRRCQFEGKDVALFRVEGCIYATQDECTHGRASLADGYLIGDEVECPLHQGMFNVRTGGGPFDFSAESDGSCLPAERGLARGLLQGRA